MTDFYKVLGVSPTATDEEVKRAYRELVKKYHPDNYANNPLEDLAVQKMQEINEAYESITQMRSGKTTQQSTSNTNHSDTNSQFPDIRKLITQNRITEAEEILDGITQNKRNAEWYFLKGSIYYSRGWLEEALTHFSEAARLNPSNPEYQAALSRMMWQRGTGRATSNGYGSYQSGGVPTRGCGACDMCQTLICADCCCDCMGGDIISCC